MAVLPIILSGGVGSRLWPLSRENHPKPFIKLYDEETLMQMSYARTTHLSGYNEIVTVTNRDLFNQSTYEASKVVPSTFKKTFLCEPERRNTTASIALASHYAASEYGDDCTILVLPADHLINDLRAFTQALKHAEELADQSQLVTFGIKPSFPKTGYGYILADGNRVDKFVEKPDKQTAEEYIASGNYLWNSGIFCMRASSFLGELSLLAPDIAEQSAKAVSRAKRSYENNIQQLEIQPTDFENIQNISVDHAVFEKSQNVGVVSCDIGWNDIGTWSELFKVKNKDMNQNFIEGDVVTKNIHNSYVSSINRLTVLIGLEDVVVMNTHNATLVANKKKTDDLNEIVNQLKLEKRDEVVSDDSFERPWGFFKIIDNGPGFKVKRIHINPMSGISLQKHEKRSEHWTVVHGRATVTINEDVFELLTGESIEVPLKTKHRILNQTNKKLEIIEVQKGKYVEEDDIIRYDDIYGRK